MAWFDWLNPQKDYPMFWQDYLSKFKQTTPEHFVAFDSETTGLDPKKDRLLSIGVVKFTPERIYVKDSFEWFIKQNKHDDESVKIHGILPSNSNAILLSESEAVKKFLEFIENATLVGHHVNFDFAMINMALKKLNAGKLKNNLKDTNASFKKNGQYPLEQNFSLDELAKKFQIKASNRHTALGDAFITAQIFQRLLH